MSLKFLVDMNLSPRWAEVFESNGWPALHWSTVGDPKATDQVIMAWALENGYTVFTHDLDFGALLAVTQAEGPSVIQVRAQDVFPEHLQAIVVGTIQQNEAVLEIGTLVIVDESTARVRVLPLRR